MAMITLKTWAARNDIDLSTARHKALKGNFKTAVKIGRDWMIDENESRTDNRFKTKTDVKRLKKINVYTHYDNNNTVIARIVPFEYHGLPCITERTYRNLLSKTTISGAGIYTNATQILNTCQPHDQIYIYVVSKNWDILYGKEF